MARSARAPLDLLFLGLRCGLHVKNLEGQAKYRFFILRYVNYRSTTSKISLTISYMIEAAQEGLTRAHVKMS